MQTEFVLRNRDPLLVLAKRATVRLANIGSEIGSSFSQVYGAIGLGGAAATEPFVVYLGKPGAGDQPFQIEICAPVTRAVEPPPGWSLTELPGGMFASVVHTGPYDSLGLAYDALEAWIAREGHAIAGPPREVYLSEPTVDPAATRTVVEFPVTAATAAVPVV